MSFSFYCYSLLIYHKTWDKYSNKSAIIRIFAYKICEIVYRFIPKVNIKIHSHWDLGMTAAMTQVPVPTAILLYILATGEFIGIKPEAHPH